MKLVQRMHKGQMWWFADFDHYQSFGIGRVWKMPTAADAMQIVNAWKLRVIDGRPFYFDRGTWRAYGNSNLCYTGV